MVREKLSTGKYEKKEKQWFIVAIVFLVIFLSSIVTFFVMNS